MRFSDDNIPELGQKVIVDYEDKKAEVGFVFGVLYRYGGIGPIVLVDTDVDEPDHMLQNANDCIKVAPAILLEYPK